MSSRFWSPLGFFGIGFLVAALYVAQGNTEWHWRHTIALVLMMIGATLVRADERATR